MAQVFANNITGLLSAGITAGATSITLNAAGAAAFSDPTPNTYFATLVETDGLTETAWEIVEVTSKAGASLAVNRGQQGTVARAWDMNTKIEMRLTADVMTLLEDARQDVAAMQPKVAGWDAVVAAGLHTSAGYLEADEATIDGGSHGVAQNHGSVNYVYNVGTVTPTRGECGFHIYANETAALSLTLTDASWQEGDIVRVSNVKGAVNITVNASTIYLPDDTTDTQVTFHSTAGGFTLVKRGTQLGVWMVLS